jgi:hypothetical protein
MVIIVIDRGDRKGLTRRRALCIFAGDGAGKKG